MLSRRTLLGLCCMAPLSLLGGCGGGNSGPNPNTQTGLGTLIVNVSSSESGIVVYLDKIARPAENGRATFYDVLPGRHEVRVTYPLNVSLSFKSVNIVADQTLTLSIQPPL